MLNVVTIQGRIPKIDHKYIKGDGNNKKSFYMGLLSVRRNYKGKDQEYYQDDLISIKAFGPNADFLENHFPVGSELIVNGQLMKDDDYEDSNGNKRYGQLYVLINQVYFCGSSDNSNSTKNNSTNNKKSASKSNNSPFGQKNSSSPFGGGNSASSDVPPWMRP